ncbi:MAG: hypothetical protein CM15mP65_08000 [Crocinitomicaceae bacterium]|nr:MAG: hypothetical protein CM15mP65_08000 [Crocinitomicaceae bacterium]
MKSTTHQKQHIHVSSLALEVLEQISFEARKSEFIDEKSGVSARLSITALENLYSTAELRLIKNEDAQTSIRVSDFMGIIPSITGKVELLYEGEQEGAYAVAELLIGDSIKTIFENYFPKINKLEKEDETTEYDDILRWFIESSKFELQHYLPQKEYESKILSVAPLKELVQKYLLNLDEKDQYFAMELVLWGLAQNKKLSKKTIGGRHSFSRQLWKLYFHVMGLYIFTILGFHSHKLEDLKERNPLGTLTLPQPRLPSCFRIRCL